MIRDGLLRIAVCLQNNVANNNTVKEIISANYYQLQICFKLKKKQQKNNLFPLYSKEHSFCDCTLHGFCPAHCVFPLSVVKVLASTVFNARSWRRIGADYVERTQRNRFTLLFRRPLVLPSFFSRSGTNFNSSVMCQSSVLVYNVLVFLLPPSPPHWNESKALFGWG